VSLPAENLAEPIRLDIGCGKNKKAGFIGVDAIQFDGVDVVFNAGTDRWPYEEGSVEEIHASHFIEHLTNFEGRYERVHFFNEVYRVLKKGCKATLVFPHWASNRYYGDPTHKEPFSEFGFYYLSKDWRAVNAPHADAQYNSKGYACDFDATWGYTLHPSLHVRNAEYQQHAMTFWKEAAQDIMATLVKK
jgi:hypothetical protein